MYRLSIALLLCSAAAFAQIQIKNPVSTTLRDALQGRSKNMIAAAEAMPADKYTYKPTDDQITFAHLIAHIIDSNNFLCAKIADLEPKTDGTKNTEGKDKLVADLKASFDFCSQALSKVDDSKLGDEIGLWNGMKRSRAAAMISITSGWADHYAAQAMYLRLNGVVPPTAKHEHN